MQPPVSSTASVTDAELGLGDLLAEHHRVVSVDLPVCRPRPPDGPTTSHHGRRHQRFCALHGWDRPHLAGNSLGGSIALELRGIGVLPAGFPATSPGSDCACSSPSGS